jgi:hypothetical protein
MSEVVGKIDSVIVYIALLVASTNADAATWIIAVENILMRA